MIRRRARLNQDSQHALNGLSPAAQVLLPWCAPCKTPAPTTHPLRTLTLRRDWLLPASLVAPILAGSYLPAHGLGGLLNIGAATIVALGLIARRNRKPQ
jgi:hypothetical protein